MIPVRAMLIAVTQRGKLQRMFGIRCAPVPTLIAQMNARAAFESNEENWQ